MSRHPLLKVSLSFLRVPEIHDGFEWTVYITRRSTVQNVIDSICEQLGLIKSLPVPGSATLDYSIEEVTREGDKEGMYRITHITMKYIYLIDPL